MSRIKPGAAGLGAWMLPLCCAAPSNGGGLTLSAQTLHSRKKLNIRISSISGVSWLGRILPRFRKKSLFFSFYSIVNFFSLSVTDFQCHSISWSQLTNTRLLVKQFRNSSIGKLASAISFLSRDRYWDKVTWIRSETWDQCHKTFL